MRSHSPSFNTHSQSPTQTLLRPIVYEAVHVPINTSIQPAFPLPPYGSPLNYRNVAPPSGQIIPDTHKTTYRTQPTHHYSPTTRHPTTQPTYHQPYQSNKQPSSTQQLSPYHHNHTDNNQFNTNQTIPLYPNIQIKSPDQHQHQNKLPTSFSTYFNPAQIEFKDVNDSLLEQQPKQQPDYNENNRASTDSFKNKLQDLKRQITPYTTTSDDHFTNDDKYRILHQEIELWKNKYKQLDNDRRRSLTEQQNQYEDDLRNQIQSLQQSSYQKIHELQNEITLLEQKLNEAVKDSERHRRRCHQLELEQFELKTQVVDAQSQKDSLQKDYDRLQIQYQKLQNDYHQMKAQNDIQRKKMSSESDMKRLQELVEAREREIEDLKSRNNQLELLCIDIKKIDSMNQELDNQLQMAQQNQIMMNDQIQKRDMEIEEGLNKQRRMQEQIRNLQNEGQRQRSMREEELLQELQRLEQIINERDYEISNQNQQAQEMALQTQRLQSTIQQMKDEFEKEFNDMQEKKNRNEKEFRENLDKKFQLLRREIEQLQNERQQLLQDLQQQSQQKVYFYRINLMNKIVFETKLHQSQQDLDHQRLLCEQKQLDNHNLQQQKDKMNRQLEQANRSIHELNQQIQVISYYRFKSQSGFIEQIYGIIQ